MKNKFFMLSLLFSFSSFAQNVLINADFSGGLSSWTTFVNPPANASFSAANSEANITGITGAGGAVWHVQLFQDFTPAQISSLQVGSTYTLSFDARSNVGSRQLRMFFGQNGGGFVPINITDFNISDVMTTYQIQFVVNQTFGNMKLGFEMGLSNNPVFIDNVSLTANPGGGGGPVAPNQPVGFVAFDNVGGNPVGSGQAFLACGPNNVGGGTVYRLFYSPTASAPVDPTTATEYSFGFTPGDGNGIAAFGFVISGLNPGTSYTFWLYQYNIPNDLFSAAPAVATVVTGGGGPVPPPAQPAGFVAFDNIGGNPVGSGQAFLACGPNNVGGIGNLVYKLFYSPTASAPVDPTTATEYTFGTTPGDGGGINAFGFTISGLMPGTSYTFWLYQYNTVTNTFSNLPAEATVVTGGGGPVVAPNQPVGFVAFNNVGGNPVTNNQVFLACGPNNVGGNIIYRLFYSPTASAPVNPLDATEYNFGETPGDGGGFNAFGFILSGLNQATEYTFWLYQYNFMEDLYSTPNMITYTTGGDPCVTEQEVDVISSCDPITWLDGNTYTSSNNTATFLAVGAGLNGCDILVTLNYTRWNCTQLQPGSCGAVDVTMDQTLRAVNVNAPAYRFRVTGANNGGAGWVSNSFVFESSNRAMKFAFVPGSLWGQTYSVDVAVGDGLGNWSPYGNACSVTLMSTIPTTQLQASDCGAINVSPLVNLLADAVTGATGYRFRVNGQGVTPNTVVEKTMGGGAMRKLKMNEVAGIVAGQTYTVEVAIRDAAGNWGAYGNACSVTLATANLLVNDTNIEMLQNRDLNAVAFTASASHNPFTTAFGIQVSNANDVEPIHVVIYDMSGKLIDRMVVSPVDIESTQFGANLNVGMYMVEVRQGANYSVIRQVKN